MALSFSLDPATARTPRLRAILNDDTLLAVQSAQTTHHGSYSAASYNLVVPISEGVGLSKAEWASLGQARVRIQVSLNPNQPFTDLVEGYCDKIQIHPVIGCAHLAGRDLSASMIDNKSPSDYQNQSPAEIVQAICQRHGLTAVVTATASFAGRCYAGNSTVVSLAQYTALSSDWDVLVCLGQTLGFDVFIVGHTLYFRPSISVSDTPQYVYAGRLVDLSMLRMLPLSGGSTVTISSWNSALGASVTATANSDSSGTASYSDGKIAASYLGMLPNASVSEAQALASRVAQSINAEAMSIEFSMPGDISLNTMQPLRLCGSNTAFDVTYKIDCIVRKFRPRSGFVQTVRAKLLT